MSDQRSFTLIPGDGCLWYSIDLQYLHNNHIFYKLAFVILPEGTECTLLLLKLVLQRLNSGCMLVERRMVSVLECWRESDGNCSRSQKRLLSTRVDWGFIVPGAGVLALQLPLTPPRCEFCVNSAVWHCRSGLRICCLYQCQSFFEGARYFYWECRLWENIPRKRLPWTPCTSYSTKAACRQFFYIRHFLYSTEHM